MFRPLRQWWCNVILYGLELQSLEWLFIDVMYFMQDWDVLYIHKYKSTADFGYRTHANIHSGRYQQNPQGIGSLYTVAQIQQISKRVYTIWHIVDDLLNTGQSLDDHGSSCSASVADSCHTVLARLELVQKSGQDAGTGAAKSVAQRDSTS